MRRPCRRPPSRLAALRACRACRAPRCGLALDVALPPLCAACREPVGERRGLCAACWSKLSFIAPPYCERLGIPFAYDPGPGVLSMEAIADPPAYERARAAVRYDDVARALVHALKYGDRLDLAPHHGPLDGARRPRAARRGRRARAGAAALAAAVGAALQPVGGARRGDLGKQRRAGRCTTRSSASGRPAAGRAVAGRARRQRAGRLPGAGRRQGRRSPAAGSSWSTTCSPPARPSMPARGRCCAPAPPRSTCWSSRGLWRRRALPYNEGRTRGRRTTMAAGRNLHHPLLPLLHAAKALLQRKGVAFTEIDVSGDRGAPRRDDRARQRPHDRAADLHRRDPCRRLRRPARARARRQARPAARQAMGPIAHDRQRTQLQLPRRPDPDALGPHAGRQSRRRRRADRRGQERPAPTTCRRRR